MIDLVTVRPSGPSTLFLSFSDGSAGNWDAAEILSRDTVMTRPLSDPDYFARAFIEAGALAWPNGLEFSARSLHARLKQRGALAERAA